MVINRTESIEFGAFLSGEYKERGKDEKSNVGQLCDDLGKWIVAIPSAGLLTFKSATSFAHESQTQFVAPQAVPVNGQYGEVVPAGALSDAVTERIVSAFDPLVELIIAVSLPVASVMMAGSALMIMVGQKDAGFKLMMNASLGYVLVQMVPLFIDLLAGVGEAV